MRQVRRLRSLAEAECYARCYGGRGHDVQLVKLVERQRPRFRGGVMSEQLRQQINGRLTSGDSWRPAGLALRGRL
jgi:hypothetical protein